MFNRKKYVDFRAGFFSSSLHHLAHHEIIAKKELEDGRK